MLVLTKSAPREHGEPRRAADVVVGDELAGLEDHLEVGGRPRPALAQTSDRDDLVVDLAVAAGEERAPVDHHVDLVGARVDGVPGVWSLTFRLARPLGKAVLTAATLIGVPAQVLAGHADQVVVDAEGRDLRAGRVLGVGPAGLGGQRADGALGVRALERREVDHPDGQVERPALAGVLDRAGAEHGGAGVRADLVDPGQTVQPAAQAGVVPGDLVERAPGHGRHAVNSTSGPAATRLAPAPDSTFDALRWPQM